MRPYTIMFLILFLLGCGSSSGGSSHHISAQSPPQTSSSNNLDFVLKPIGDKQVLPFNNLMRCEVINRSSLPHKLNALSGIFTSSNPNFRYINVELLIDGKKHLDIKKVDGLRIVDLDINITIQPGNSVFIYLLVHPHTLHVNDTINFEVVNVAVDNQIIKKTLKPSTVTINPGPFAFPLFFDIPVFIPLSSGVKDVVSWSELLIRTSNIEQELYDYEIRFRAGRRNKLTDPSIRGSVSLEVMDIAGTPKWRKVDELPIAGHRVSQHYKLFFFGEHLPPNKKIRVIINLTKFKKNGHYCVSRTTIGGSTGFINFPTRHGPEIKIR